MELLTRMGHPHAGWLADNLRRYRIGEGNGALPGPGGRPRGPWFQNRSQHLVLAFSPAGHTVAAGSGDGSVRLWDTALGRPLGPPQAHGKRILAVAFVAQLDGSWDHLKECGDEDCTAVFYDRSRNHSGKWCSMQSCGNKNKVRAFRARQRSRVERLSARGGIEGGTLKHQRGLSLVGRVLDDLGFEFHRIGIVVIQALGHLSILSPGLVAHPEASTPEQKLNRAEPC